MSTSKVNAPKFTTSEQWQEAFRHRAIEHWHLESETALYEAAFAADDQADQVGPNVNKWTSPVSAADNICACWDRQLLDSAGPDFDCDFNFESPALRARI